ncbi:xanthine dehydrogenase family protein molybdopterin-binding subunit [Pseudohongiella spirulinae]|uniref:Oxidoreductase n=1 Tax=Pseudohongiella spirulinae TaxID=1249552 RepID=A0A0S2KFZ7_9GAMM|nr:xanthine dehydrogenase family protein molybdopterin-binding subunit [Pseudohongiella spirulinae]ALO47240.1 oxidoreductase [Pseudohongiella spirulinae]
MSDVSAQAWRVLGSRPIRPDGADKVTGVALYGADKDLPDSLTGKVLRSPYAHARILHLDVSAALAIEGVEAVITAADMPELPDDQSEDSPPPNFRDLSANLLARGKVLYEGHAVAAVAAIDEETAARALQAIDVEYAVLPHVIDVQKAMEPDAPLLHERLYTKGIEPAPKAPSNIASRYVQCVGDVEVAFAQADIIVSEEFTTAPVHQGYIEPHACLARVNADQKVDIWCSSQGQFMVRDYCARLLAMDSSAIRVHPLEIGGGFGGKTTIYLEPLAVLLAQRSGRPVKMQMSRAEVFKATGPAPGTYISLRLGAREDGCLVAAQGVLCYQAGAFPGSPVRTACMAAFAPYDIPSVKLIGYDVVVNRPKSAAYRAPGAPMASFAAESLLDMLARKLDMDPLELRLKNAVADGSMTSYGVILKNAAYRQVLQAARRHPHWTAPLAENQGRGIASGFWFNIGGQSSASITLNDDGTVNVLTANPDIGGSRASMAMMAAETLGIDLQQVVPQIVDTDSIAHSDLTGGSRVTFAVGTAVTEACHAMIAELRERGANIWGLDIDAVRWSDGQLHASIDGNDVSLSLVQIAALARQAGKSVAGHASLNVKGAAPAFGTHICDVEVDPQTGQVRVLRYTAVQDVGTAIHPDFVEGQIQGGITQGIGWALNEAYLYDDNGCLLNPGFLDYRMPVAADLPMIETVLVEEPNSRHPYGVKGVGEVPIVPPLGAVANAIASATGVRLTDLPMNPPTVYKALKRAAMLRRR